MEHIDKVKVAGLVVIGAAILLAVGYVWGETTGFIAAAVVVLLLLGVVSSLLTSYVFLNEMEVGVVFDRHGKFVCFLDNDYGRIYPRPANAKPYEDQTLPPKRSQPLVRHHINPALEVVRGKLRKGSFEASSVSNDVRTKEGIPVTIPWSVSFRIEVLRIQPGIEYKMARALPENAAKMVAGRMQQIIQHAVGQKSIEELYATPDSAGAIQKLEDEVRHQLLTKAKAIGLTGIAAHDLKIGPIELPRQIEATLRIAHQRYLYTSTVAKSLNALREVIAAFSPEDIQRLTELERLRILDEKTKSLILTEPFLMTRRSQEIGFSEDEPFLGNGYGHESKK